MHQAGILERLQRRGGIKQDRLLLLGDERGLVLGESSADGAGLLRPEIERSVLLVLVEEAEVVSLLGVDDGERGERGAVVDVLAAGLEEAADEEEFEEGVCILEELERGSGLD